MILLIDYTHFSHFIFCMAAYLTCFFALTICYRVGEKSRLLSKIIKTNKKSHNSWEKFSISSEKIFSFGLLTMDQNIFKFGKAKSFFFGFFEDFWWLQPYLMSQNFFFSSLDSSWHLGPYGYSLSRLLMSSWYAMTPLSVTWNCEMGHGARFSCKFGVKRSKWVYTAL